MAVGVFMEFPGVTWEQYEQLVQDWVLAVRQKGSLSTCAVPHQMEDGVRLTCGSHRRRSSGLPMSCSSPRRGHSGFPSRRSESFSNPSTS